MADTSGIAALMKALNETPGLGGGLKSSGVSRTSGIAKTSGTSGASGLSAIGGSSRPILAASDSPTQQPAKLPKILSPGGGQYDPKAPRGTYVNMVV